LSIHQIERHRRDADRQPYPDDHRVLTFRQWCELNGISLATGRRLLNAGNGPVFLQLSPRRIGVTVAANRAWQQSLARGA
jgi:hypothetical protein